MSTFGDHWPPLSEEELKKQMEELREVMRKKEEEKEKL